MRALIRLSLVLSLCALPAVAAAQDPAPGPDRSMEFRPGVGEEARENVPGGRLAAMAYAAALLALGGYVAYLGRRAAKLDADLTRLEDDLARKRGDAEDAP
jgi:CcmD family protein